MENPFKVIGEAVTAGLEKLHKRADTVEADVAGFKDEVAGFKLEVVNFSHKIEDDNKGVLDRLSKLEAMFEPEAVAAVTDKVSAVGSDTSAPAPAAPTEPALAPEATDTAPPATEPSTGSATPSAPVSVEAPSGAVVTIDPTVGTTTHEDASGIITSVPHDGTAPTAVNAADQPVEPSQAAVAEAINATAQAGVAITPVG